MRYLIISDLHSNLEALQAVEREADGQYDSVICCGDLVGYGADPNTVTEWVRTHCSLVVRGNHDRACTGMEDLEWFNPVARSAAVWTQSVLKPENQSYIRGLPKGPIKLGDFEVAHGSPFDEDEYVSAASDAANAFDYLDARLSFFGHTHVQGGYIWNHARIETVPRIPPAAERHILEIDPACAYLINPGSVGQPRDGDPRAAFALYDSECQMVSYWRVSYDIETAQRKIEEAGLPPVLAGRLTMGR